MFSLSHPLPAAVVVAGDHGPGEIIAVGKQQNNMPQTCLSRMVDKRAWDKIMLRSMLLTAYLV